jgi:two-component system sensor histidine kinase MprB
MTLRTRVTFAAGVAVLVVVLALHLAVYYVVRANLRVQLDDSLRHSVPEAHGVSADEMVAATTPQHVPLVHEAFMQLVDDVGNVVAAFDDRTMPVTDAVIAVANGEREDAFFDARVEDASVRIYAVSAGEGMALQVGRSLSEVDATLRRLVFTLTGISVVAVGVAAIIGRLVAAAAATPVRRVAEAAESVARTGDLSHHIEVRGGDDLDRLATSFNTMLDALDDSLSRQRQLVADASHELRTPLATVRTNVEVLARVEELPPDERAALIRDTVAQTGELTRLVGDLVELARGDIREEPATATDLNTLTERAVDSARRNYPGIVFTVSGTATHVRGVPDRLTRAISNLLDNAAKWTPPGGTVDVSVNAGAVSVCDHGPGIDPDDLPNIFDRFYRATAARTMPGSGLGLAIVKQVAESHGGTVTAEAAPGGGTRFRLTLPAATPEG